MTDLETKEMMNAMQDDKAGVKDKNLFLLDSKKELDQRLIRFLPPLAKKGEKVFYHKHFTHWIDNQKHQCCNSVLVDADGNVHEPQRCPICEYVSKLYKTSDRGSEEWRLAGALRRRERFLSRIVDRESDEPTRVLFFEYGPTIYEMLYNYIINSEFGNIVDPKKGRDYKIVKKGVQRNASYSASSPSLKESPLFEDATQLKECLKNASEMDYNSMIKYESPAELKRALDEYLGNYDEPAEKPAISSKPAPTPFESFENSTEEKSTSVETDEIDDILNEFTT